MKVLFSSHDLEMKHKRGIGFYSKSLLESLKNNNCEIDLLTSCDNEDKSKVTEQHILDKITNGSAHNYGYKRKLIRLCHKLFSRTSYFSFVTKDLRSSPTSDVSFLMYISNFVNAPLVYDIEYLWNKFLKSPFKIKTKSYDVLVTAIPGNVKASKGTKIVQTLHDVIPLEEKPLSSYGNVIRNMVEGMTKTSDIIIAVSEYSKSRLLHYFPDTKAKIVVTHQPIPIYKEEEEMVSKVGVAEDIVEKYGLTYGEYFLYIGAIEERKNILGLIQAYEQCNLTKPLVLAGGIDGNDVELSRKMAEIKAGKIPNVVYLGYVSNVDKLCLLKGAYSFVFLSFSEGFGIPPLEAMKMGTSVICSNKTSLPEVCGDAALLVDPENREEIKAALQQLDSNQELRSTLIQKGNQNIQRFTFEKYYETISYVLKSL